MNLKGLGLKSVRNAIRRRMPREAMPILRALYGGTYVRFVCWYADLRDRRRVKEAGFARVPPATLRYRVHGDPGLDGFLGVGRRCSEDVIASLEKSGGDFDSLGDVLDFGCGCGRTLLWFGDRFGGRSPSPRLHGTDIDAEAISWCRENLGFADFRVNEALPPLDYPSEKFDLIYAISVFTHLDEEYQFRWLAELKRVTKPGGFVLLTVHGRHFWKDLRREDIADIKRDGFKFVASNSSKGIFPEWYQNAFHTKKYVRRRYSKYFDVLDYLPRGMDRKQDLVVLRRP